MATFLPLCQEYSLDRWREFILGFDGSYSTSFFPSHSRSLGTLFPPLPCFFLSLPPTPTTPPHPTPPLNPPPATSLSFPPPPSPIPLSQLPVELAAIQDSADGSVIRSASLRSLFSSPFFSSPFSLRLIKLQKKTSVHLDLSFAETVWYLILV